ncbi:Plastid lipid-associated protein/fibrillin conserved domain-containing protein [Artemisia annua]|uniref:Plastid lipid-associated protein/fibrillin conserved domain-containing protein n=1 Tax=Artemisia annua TaxID=35608 RepID=A0A2U1KYD9_ARTAN|nr:Plastid lipid-associated protein/fibrillin conserved domain-containing protein [Artemisia annua]
MACCSVQSMVPSVSGLSSSSSVFNCSSVIVVPMKFGNQNMKKIGKRYYGVCKAMVQQQTSAAAQGASATYAKEMERLSAKESLLLAPVAVYIPRRFPTTLASLCKMDLVIKEGYAKITANLKFLNAIENNLILSTKLTVEGPLRMKEEYTEGVLETPTVNEETIPQQLKGALGQAVNTIQQLPSPVKDAVSGGLRIPLNGAFQRLFMISYLDEEILIIRDTTGVPEVLTRLDVVSSPSDPIEEYES